MSRTLGDAYYKVRPDLDGFGVELSAKLRVAFRQAAAAGVPSDMLARPTEQANRLGTALRGALKTGGFVLVGAAAASAAARVAALAASALSAARAVALLPAGAVGMAAGIGTLKLAFGGLGTALKETAEASGSAATGERQLAAAQRTARQAQDDLNDARAAAAERVEDLSRSLRRAGIEERQAARTVQAAARDLELAQFGGDPADIARAQDNYDLAALSLEEAADRTKDLAREQADAAKRGVEGSREVQAALQRQADALDALAAAQRGGASASSQAADAMSKLSPAGQALVRTVRAVSPAWADMRKQLQQTTLAGAAGDVAALSKVWLPVASRRLGQFGSAWNLALHQTAGLAKQPSTVRDIDIALGGAARAAGILARAVRPIVEGVLQFVAAGSSGLPVLAGDVASLATRFRDWAVAARESGRAQDWIANAISTGRRFITIVWNIASAVTAAVGAAGDGGNTLDTLVRGSAALKDWAQSAEGQQRIAGIMATLRNVLTDLAAVLPTVVGENGALTDTFSVARPVIGFLADHVDTLAKLMPVLAAGFVLSKVAQTGANLAAVAAVPLRVAEVASNIRRNAMLRANTAALVQNTAAQRVNTASQVADNVATNAGILAKARAVISMVAQRVATVATAVATGAWTAVQWLLNVALTANPIGLIVLAIAALVAGIIYAYKNSETFRRIVDAAFRGVKVAIAAVVDWVVNVAWPFIKRWFDMWVTGVKLLWSTVSTWFGRLVDFVTGIPDKIKKGAASMWDGIVASAKGAVNKVLSIWNSLDLGFEIKVPNWVPEIGGKSFGVADLFPDIPLLARGGLVKAKPGGTAAVLAEAGQDEIAAPVQLMRQMIAEAVAAAGGGEVTVNLVANHPFIQAFMQFLEIVVERVNTRDADAIAGGVRV